VEERMFPALSVATHRLREGQEMPVNALVRSTLLSGGWFADEKEPGSGRFKVTMWPSESPAMHRVDVGQETASMGRGPTLVVNDAAGTDQGGETDPWPTVTTELLALTTAHTVEEGSQESAFAWAETRPGVVAGVSRAQHAEPAGQAERVEAE
jgi:hypothetical protein